MAAGKVILYFENQEDALHFTLAAGSLIAGDRQAGKTDQVLREIERASRIRVKGTLSPSGNH
jgi:hypothetical protein